MKTSLWIIVVVVAGLVGFLVGYSSSASTGTRGPQAAGQGGAAELAEVKEDVAQLREEVAQLRGLVAQGKAGGPAAAPAVPAETPAVPKTAVRRPAAKPAAPKAQAGDHAAEKKPTTSTAGY